MRATSTRRPRLASVLAGLCLLVLVAGLVLGVVLRSQAQELEDRETARAEVVQAAQRFTVTWNTMDPKNAEDYVENVRGLMTEELRKEAFGGEDEEAAKLIRKGGITSDAKVLVDEAGIPLVGISTVDPNSASVMVVADSRRTVNGQRVMRHWRWQLELVNEGGDWLVNELTPV